MRAAMGKGGGPKQRSGGEGVTPSSRGEGGVALLPSPELPGREPSPGAGGRGGPPACFFWPPLAARVSRTHGPCPVSARTGWALSLEARAAGWMAGEEGAAKVPPSGHAGLQALRWAAAGGEHVCCGGQRGHVAAGTAGRSPARRSHVTPGK